MELRLFRGDLVALLAFAEQRKELGGDLERGALELERQPRRRLRAAAKHLRFVAVDVYLREGRRSVPCREVVECDDVDVDGAPRPPVRARRDVQPVARKSRMTGIDAEVERHPAAGRSDRD